MRYAIASQALCGALTVAAVAVPTRVCRRTDLVDLSEFKSFPTMDPQQILNNANAAIRELFSQGHFKDGPMDEHGNWVGRPVAILDESKDEIRHVSGIVLDNIEGIFSGDIKDAGNKMEDFLGKLGAQPQNQNQNQNQDSKKVEVPPQHQGQDPDGAKLVNHAVTNSTAASASPSTTVSIATAASPAATTISTATTASPATTVSQVSTVVATAPVASQTSNGQQAGGTCQANNPNVRFEWSDYTDSDRTAFVQAIKCLQNKPSGGSQFSGAQNRYEDLISVHREMTNNIHQTATFLVWHRYFVWVFEQLLRNECGFDRAMPWWDETKYAGAFASSDVFSDDWFGALPNKTADNQGTCITTGAFANTVLHVGPGSANTPHCLSRAVDETDTAQCNENFINSCLSNRDYNQFRQCLELGPHGYGHNGIGAVMEEVSSSVGDPIFFMHHLFVDHAFRIWQNAYPSRRETIDGCADAANPCTPISVNTTLSSNGLGPDVTVGEILNTLSGTLCYRYDY